MAAQRLRERGACFHIGGDLADEFAHRRFLVAAAMICRLCTRGTPAESMVVIWREMTAMSIGDLGAALGEEPLALLADPGDVDALLAQLGLDGGDAVGLQLAGDLLSLAVDAVPAVGEDFFGALRFELMWPSLHPAIGRRWPDAAACPAHLGLKKVIGVMAAASPGEMTRALRTQLVVILLISARLVTPRRAFSRPDVRRVRIPSFWAIAAICSELAPCMMSLAMLSDISMIS